MKSKPKSSAEYDTFQAALRQVLRVSHSELQQRLQQEKKVKASKPRPSSGRASSGKG